MKNLQDITRDIESLRNLQALIGTYESIAVFTVRLIKNAVLQNRSFIAGINRVYQEVKRAYRRETEKISAKKEMQRKKEMIGTRDGVGYVFLSANSRLYGDVVERTFALFLSTLEKKHANATIIGKVGKTLFENAMPGKKFVYFDFPDDKIDEEKLHDIARHLVQFGEVIVFHGLFRSFLNQEPTASNLTGDVLSAQSEGKEEVKYLFEPSIETVVQFFEKEIFEGLLEQAFQESRFAKVTSRMVELDRSFQTIEHEVLETARIKQRLQHQQFNKKQLNAMTGVSLWNAGASHKSDIRYIRHL